MQRADDVFKQQTRRRSSNDDDVFSGNAVEKDEFVGSPERGIIGNQNGSASGSGCCAYVSGASAEAAAGPSAAEAGFGSSIVSWSR